MTNTLQALLAGSIDYAGMYHPAALPLPAAVTNYRQYRTHPDAWMLGRFVCPATALTDLDELGWRDRDGPLALLVPGGDTAEAFELGLGDALAAIRQTPVAGAIAALELRWPAALLREADAAALRNLVASAAGRVAALKLPPVTLYLEFSPVRTNMPDAAWREALQSCVAALAEYSQTHPSHSCVAGLKFRTGGTEASAFPGSADLAFLIGACRDGGVFWKATAGLHHPLRHRDPATGAMLHGFLNVLTATVLADVQCLDTDRIQAVLDDVDRGSFRFSDETLCWRDQVASADQILFARERSLRSFGSCSFDEPREDLHALGLF